MPPIQRNNNNNIEDETDNDDDDTTGYTSFANTTAQHTNIISCECV